MLVQAGSFLLAGVLLYLALQGVDFQEVGRALREADYRWIVPLGVATLLSHLLRAWRWQVLLEALPDEDDRPEPKRVSLKTAFYSLMIGYMVNYAAPRLGEVVRTANLSAREKLPFSGVLGTVVVERLLDALVLALGVLSAFFLLLDRSDTLQELFLDPMMEQLGRLPALALLGVLIGVTVLLWLLFRSLLRQSESWAALFWKKRVRPVLVSFKDGLATVLRSPRRVVLVVSTTAIWACYLLMAYLPFVMFGMASTYDLSMLDGWSIMMLGAVGVAIPSPGGVGSYHYIVIKTLVFLYGVAEAEAAAYAVFVHGGQLVLYAVVGFLCILLQGSSLGAIRRTARTAQTATETPVQEEPPLDAPR